MRERDLSGISLLCYKGSAMAGTEHDVSGGPIASDWDAKPGRHPDEALGGEASLPPDFEDELASIIDTAERLAGSPVAAWGAIKAEVERRLAHQQEWASSGTGEPTHKRVAHDRPGPSIGGSMPTHPGVATQARRQFIGFDLETATYMRIKPELLSRFPGKFVVIVGEEVEGPVETFQEALRAGYRRFGLGPLFIKQILSVEPVVEATREITPCRS
jgi:hypothetical protein